MHDTKDNQRRLSPLDHLLSGLQAGLPKSDTSATQAETRPSPGHTAASTTTLNANQRRHAAGLMRVNHAGEVAAQALYQGQALTAQNPAIREHLLEAAQEERDHLAWCKQRLEALDSHASLLDPLWFGGAYLMGAAAGLAGDKISLGFVAETERQVAAHLEGHLNTLPVEDHASRAVVTQMHADETRHGQEAIEQGGVELPAAIRALMHITAKVMTRCAYHL